MIFFLFFFFFALGQQPSQSIKNSFSKKCKNVFKDFFKNFFFLTLRLGLESAPSKSAF